MKKFLILLAALSLPAKAATVTSTADDGPGSLREAIANAAAGETITFSVSDTITLTSGELLITNDLTILGPGASELTVQRSTETNTPDFRIFNLRSGEVTISGLSLSNGREIDGGGIYNESMLTIRDCVIKGNFARWFGGGIFNGGAATAIGSVISSNSVDSNYGGGIYNDSERTLVITKSFIRANSAVSGFGGGIYNLGNLTVNTSVIASNCADFGGGISTGLGTLALVRSTVNGNSGVFGGGIRNVGGLAILESSSLSGNVGDLGGGILTWDHAATALANSTVTANIGGGTYNVVGYVVFGNSILAGNSGGADVGNSDQVGRDWERGRTESSGFNLIGSTNGVITPGTNDQFDVTAERLRLGPLQDNGGPTFTHALLCGSVAINAGDSSDAPATDQRGFPRIMGGAIDVGAYESGNRPGKLVNADGCTLEELCPCDAPWRNHGEYVTCIIAHAWEFYRDGLISLSERQTIIRDAARSDCGKAPTDPERVRIHTQPQTPLEIRQDGFQIILSGEIPGGCVLESSTNLTQWVAIQTNQAASAEMQIADPNAGDVPVRFYRVRLWP